MDDSLSSPDWISGLATEIDQAIDSGDSKELYRLIDLANELYNQCDLAFEKASVAFCRANAHSALGHVGTNRDPNHGWGWTNHELKQEIYWLRVALIEVRQTAKSEPKGDLELRILTNLANALNHTGRFCEAIEHWDKAVSLEPTFGMAVANRGYGLLWYARALYDDGHQSVFFWQAQRALKTGLSYGVEAHSLEEIKANIAHLDAMGDWQKFSVELNSYSLGDEKSEQQYRRWCLSNRLFLNPLNDLGTHNIAGRDVLTFPSITLPVQRAGPIVPEVYGIFNQIVQEFISARYLIFEALQERQSEAAHFSDRDVVLYDTLDYRILRLWAEKLKMSYLSAFAIFDKIAYLLNHYLNLGLKSSQVNFRSLWFNNRDPKKGVIEELEKSRNWPLRGLFALSQDLYWKADGSLNAEPEARTLNDIRQYIAHKYLTVHDSFCSALGAVDAGQKQSEISYPIADEELILATKKLLKLVRSATIYLSLAANWHEQEKNKKGDGLCVPMLLNPLGDDRL